MTSLIITPDSPVSRNPRGRVNFVHETGMARHALSVADRFSAPYWTLQAKSGGGPAQVFDP